MKRDEQRAQTFAGLRWMEVWTMPKYRKKPVVVEAAAGGGGMTNREGFNQHIRTEVAEQIAYMERMTDKELVEYIRKVPGYHIEEVIGDELSYYKATHAPLPVGSYDTVTEWLGEEAEGGRG